MALSSPGVEVKVIDESFYTPAEPGTTPLVIVASAENKSNGAGTGTAPGTTKANAGKVYLLTSQRDLADTFGDPVFKTDAGNNPIHAGEQNEYGLQAAYSLLGVSNRAFVVRADLDLSQLDASADPPIALPANGTHWMDTSTSLFGIFEWNGAAISTTGGQKFANKVPIVITDSTKVSAGAPLGSVGSIGDYAIVMTDTDPDTPALTTSHPGELWYKSKGNANAGVTAGTWVNVGSEDWHKSVAVVAGTVSNPAFAPGDNFYINGVLVTASGVTASSLATDINNAFGAGAGPVYAQAYNNKLEIYTNGMASSGGDSTQSNAVIIAAGTQGTLVTSSLTTSSLGIKTGTYYGAKMQISKHTDVPQWKSTTTGPRPTGSVWVKTTEPNLGARWRVKRWNSTTEAWVAVDSPIYLNGHEAVYNLDKAGGGANLATGSLYVQANYTEDSGTDATPMLGNFKLFRRAAAGECSITSAKITASTFTNATSYIFRIAESLVGTSVLGDYNGNGTYSYKTVSFQGAGNAEDNATRVASAVNAAGFTNIEASVDSQNRVTITHKIGGDFRLTEGNNTPLVDMGFSAYVFEPSEATYSTGTANLSETPAGDALHNFVASLWHPLVYVSNADAPGSLTDDGRLWYSSVIDEIDIMIHDGSDWVGYKSATAPYYANGTDPNGPIVSATAPETQSGGQALVTGDLWISTDDIENFPQIYRFNNALTSPISKRWELLDKTDQSTEDGVLFADARYNTAGANSDEAGTIVDLLTSNYVDPDAPDPALYPQGMLLWNLRRSGFNVKRFVRNYVDIAADNPRSGEAMEAYYPHRWVTTSPNQGDGSGSFGRKAQRSVVVTALQATVNANQDIRDDESRIFNLIACPGYPELIGEMITLNYDRGLTAFVIGDSPARLTPDATSLLAWGSNQRLAFEDNDLGAVSFDEYMAMFYPWGFTSDNFGNNVVVPPSHMIMRTIALNDQVAYPWFAPAGIRRGGITNASAVGYVDSQEGEFRSVALNVGQRDTLYEQKINPITFLTGTGLVNYGQKTRAKGASALDRINVARLVIYLRSQLNKLAKPYIFEPNDKITRDEIKLAVDSLLLELVGQRALYDFLVVCDESNNTPSRIDRNELYIDIAIEPVKAVEFIYIPLRLKNTGEIAALG
jgi:hypothetical protein